MQMKKITALLLALAMSLSMAACGAQAPASSESETTETAQATEAPAASSEAASPEAAAGDSNFAVIKDKNGDTYAVLENLGGATEYPVTITDQAGRQVTIEQKPETLVSGYYISTSMLIALGLQDELVGIEAKADTRPIYNLSAPELLELPSVGTAKEFDLEGCAALDPDLVILPLKLKDAADSLAELGITAIVVNPEDQFLLEEDIVNIATATDTQDRAKELLDFTQEQQTRLTGTLALSSAERPSVYLAGNSDFLSTAGGEMYQSSMIELAGGTNVAASLTDSYWVDVSYEQVLAWDPDYIVLASDASYTVDDVLNDPNLAGCAAVQNGRVIQIPGDAEAWDSPVPSGILGSVWLASQLHPDLCPEADTTAIINDFYETFYGFTYSEN